MRNEFTAIIQQDGEWLIAFCPEIPGANGQGKTKPETLESLADAIVLLLGIQSEEGLRGLSADAEVEKVIVQCDQAHWSDTCVDTDVTCCAKVAVIPCGLIRRPGCANPSPGIQR